MKTPILLTKTEFVYKNWIFFKKTDFVDKNRLRNVKDRFGNIVVVKEKHYSSCTLPILKSETFNAYKMLCLQVPRKQPLEFIYFLQRICQHLFTFSELSTEDSILAAFQVKTTFPMKISMHSLNVCIRWMCAFKICATNGILPANRSLSFQCREWTNKFPCATHFNWPTNDK